MARLLCFAILTSFVSVAPNATHAGDYIQMGHRRNVCWPKPYIYPDRAGVAAPFAVMVNNGWRRQNLLGDHHFETDNSELSTAGSLKIQWILTQAPASRRTVFLSQTISEEANVKRLETVLLAASKILPIGMAADVQQSHLVIEGRSAETIDTINVRFRQNMPIPILPAPTGDSFEE